MKKAGAKSKASSAVATETETVQPPAELEFHERRKHERAECDGPAEVVMDGASLMFRGRIKNLSPTGCYIDTHARLRLGVGTAAELCFTVNERSFKAIAEVKWIRPSAGVGFEILFLVAESREPSDLLALIQKLEAR
jgi:hypothetical protein